jgi:hypothetical protein
MSPSCLGCQKPFATQRRLRGHETKCRDYQLLQLCIARPRKRLKRTLDNGENPHPPSPAAEVNVNPQFLGSSSETRGTAKPVEAEDKGADKGGGGDSGDNSDSDSDGGAITSEGEGEESEELSEGELWPGDTLGRRRMTRAAMTATTPKKTQIA